MSTTEGDEPEDEKKYCCGNSAQNEAGYVSKCDIVLEVYGVITYILLTVLTFLSPQTVLDFANKNPTFREVAYYLDMRQLYQITFVTCAILWHLFELGLAILLLKGSTDRNNAFLKLWFNLTIVTVLIGIIISGVIIYFTKEKTTVGATALIYYLYKWYGLWICTELRREIKLGINPYALPSDF